MDYAPSWIKEDPKKYFHAEKARYTISPLCDAALAADERAFAALMKHILSVDQQQRTVIMMQVENETGMVDTDRDYSPEANAKFAGPVPKELMDYLEVHRAQLGPTVEVPGPANTILPPAPGRKYWRILRPRPSVHGLWPAMWTA